MFQLGFQDRRLSAPSQKRGVVAFLGWNLLSSKLWLGFVWLLMICFGMASQAQARCGASINQMPWKYSSNAELIRMNRSAFMPVAGSMIERGGVFFSGISHDQDLPCTSCRCRNEKEPGIPIESTSNESSTKP